jgi:hypothetical protein
MTTFSIDVKYFVEPLESCRSLPCFTSFEQREIFPGRRDTYMYTLGVGFEIHWMASWDSIGTLHFTFLGDVMSVQLPTHLMSFSFP